MMHLQHLSSLPAIAQSSAVLKAGVPQFPGRTLAARARVAMTTRRKQRKYDVAAEICPAVTACAATRTGPAVAKPCLHEFGDVVTRGGGHIGKIGYFSRENSRVENNSCRKELRRSPPSRTCRARHRAVRRPCVRRVWPRACLARRISPSAASVKMAIGRMTTKCECLRTHENKHPLHRPILPQHCHAHVASHHVPSHRSLFCDSCNVAVHQGCYGSGARNIPDGPWYCDSCSYGRRTGNKQVAECVLCPTKGGALKRTSDFRWAHIVCGLWIPEAEFLDAEGRDIIHPFTVNEKRCDLTCVHATSHAPVSPSPAWHAAAHVLRAHLHVPLHTGAPFATSLAGRASSAGRLAASLPSMLVARGRAACTWWRRRRSRTASSVRRRASEPGALSACARPRDGSLS